MKLTFVENFSVKWKMIFLVGTMFTMFGIFLIFQYFEINSLWDNDTVSEMHLTMLEARRSEKDFFIRKDLSYADNVTKAVEKMDLLVKPFEDELIGKQFNESVHEYEKIFQNMVTLMKLRGCSVLK